MLDQLYLKTLQIESLSQHSFGKFYTITELESSSRDLTEIEVLQLIRQVVSEDIKKEVQGHVVNNPNLLETINL